MKSICFIHQKCSKLFGKIRLLCDDICHLYSAIIAHAQEPMKLLHLYTFIHWFRRFFTLKRDFENGRDTSDTAKGLFRRRTRRSMDAEIWFENYRDTIADKMPDSSFYHLPSCQTKKTVYLTYVEETKKIGVHKPLSRAQFLRMWRKNYKRVIIPKV